MISINEPNQSTLTSQPVGSTGPIGSTGPVGPTITYVTPSNRHSMAPEPWVPTFLWRPRKIKGNWKWLTEAFCRRQFCWEAGQYYYEYGDAFDVLRNS